MSAIIRFSIAATDDSFTTKGPTPKTSAVRKKQRRDITTIRSFIDWIWDQTSWIGLADLKLPSECIQNALNEIQHFWTIWLGQGNGRVVVVANAQSLVDGFALFRRTIAKVHFVVAVV